MTRLPIARPPTCWCSSCRLWIIWLYWSILWFLSAWAFWRESSSCNTERTTLRNDVIQTAQPVYTYAICIYLRYLYILTLCIYLHHLYILTLPVYNNTICIYLHYMYILTLPVYTYTTSIYLHYMYILTLPVYTYTTCIYLHHLYILTH